MFGKENGKEGWKEIAILSTTQRTNELHRKKEGCEGFLLWKGSREQVWLIKLPCFGEFPSEFEALRLGSRESRERGQGIAQSLIASSESPFPLLSYIDL